MNPLASPLLTDLYQLTMLQTYFAVGMRDTAVFELFVRKLPESRNFMVAAGLEQALEFLENMRFGEEELEWIRASGLFKADFAEHLASLRFTGDVHAMPEGTVFFPNEPLLRVTAPMPEAQLIESRLLNLVHYETVVATKAARSVLAAPGKQLVDFGLRRAHGAEAGMLAARASYIAGYTGTATVLAAARYGIPVFGTMAHSFIEAHENETQAFEDFARAFPKGTVFLVDTYDTETGVKKVAALAPRLAREGIAIKGVRLDSGDLVDLARSARQILDAAGLQKSVVFASGNLDEYVIAKLLAAEAPIDGFGVGTSLTTSLDVPSLDAVYKLQEYAGRARRKRSTGKATWPGRKQVYRHYAGDGKFGHDLVALESDRQDGEPLLVPVMRAGRRTGPPEEIAAMRGRVERQLAALPPALRSLDAAAPYRVEIAEGLRALADELDREMEAAAEVAP
jgi:nicotinate phosphoribosyltransferase